MLAFNLFYDLYFIDVHDEIDLRNRGVLCVNSPSCRNLSYIKSKSSSDDLLPIEKPKTFTKTAHQFSSRFGNRALYSFTGYVRFLIHYDKSRLITGH